MIRKLTLAVLAVAMIASAANATDFDILWYTGGLDAGGGEKTEFTSALIDALVFNGLAVGSVQYWDAGAAPAPVSDDFDLLIVSSWVGPWSGAIDYTALDAALTSGALTIGERRVVTGQDVDWHYAVDPDGPGSGPFDGPQGMFANAASWASQGGGMGAFFIGAGAVNGAAGDPGIYLPGLGTRFDNHGANVNIVDPLINSGLTDAGLSNWGDSHHNVWTGYDTNIWKAVTTTADTYYSNPGGAVTLVSAVPEPGTLALLGLGLAGAGLRFRRKK